ncbi:hypothetical protein B7P43_G13459, partial [Cryptotermes secundus]
CYEENSILQVGDTFSEGKGNFTDEERSGWPSTCGTEENIAKVYQILPESRRMTVISIAVQENIDRETVRKILTEDLEMRMVCAIMDLFPKIKEILKGRPFNDIDDIICNTTAALKAILQTQFQSCFEGWTRRQYEFIASQGEYFEGDHSSIHQ